MYQRFGEVRKHGMKSFERPRVDARGQAVIDVTTGRVIVDVFSNRKHIETICTAVTDADARFMALLERPVEDVDGAIAAIEASVPWSLVNDLERL
jgi:hypothetical protein